MGQKSRLRISCRRPGLQHLLERREPAVLVEAGSFERAVLPRPHLQLPGPHRILHIDSCFTEPPEVVLPSVGVDEMEGLVPAIETILDVRAKHAVLLVIAVEERTNVSLLTEGALGKLQRTFAGFHMSPSGKESGAIPTRQTVAAAARFDPAGRSSRPSATRKCVSGARISPVLSSGRAALLAARF